MKAEDKSEQYRDFREQCGINNPVMLNEIEEAYYEGYLQAEKDITDKAKTSSGWDGFYYGQGYHQAEKDLELTVDDIMKIDALLIDMWNRPSNEDKYQEVLKRFKNMKDGTTSK